MIAFISLSLGALVIVSCQDILPKPGECGTLNSTYMYNRKTVTKIDEFPWMGRIIKRSGLKYWCTAVLISHLYMTTVAHCKSTDEYFVILGDWNMRNNISEPDCEASGRCVPVPSLYEIDDIIVHSNYDPEARVNDIAVVRLSGSVNYTNYIRPICLPPPEVKGMEFVAQHLQLTGWYTGHYVKKTKSFAHILSRSYCKRIMYVHMSRTNRHMIDENSPICAYTCTNATSDGYQSGSALMGVAMVQEQPAYYYLVGMQVYVTKKSPASNPSILSNVIAHLEWIKENIS